MEKLKVFNHPWHLANQHEFAKLPFVDLHWLRQCKRPFGVKTRGQFPVTMVESYEPGKYDFALLHLDNQCVEPEIWARGKGRLYRELNQVIKDIPKIVINHGTPYYPEKFPSTREDGCSDELVEKMREAIGDNTMVVNSHAAAKQWGFGTPIVHGIEATEWFDLPKERRVVTMISPGGLDMYYDRQFFAAVKEKLMEDYEISLCHITVDWQSQDFDDYRNFIGRSLVYFNPTRESPMPRSRTEAMLSGCCVITTPSQDAGDFIQHGVNGFITRRDPAHACELIVWALTHYDEARAIGQKGKETAIKLFNKERYQEEWRQLVSKVMGREIGEPIIKQ